MELRSATQGIQLRICDVLTGDNADESTEALSSLVKMTIPKDSAEHVHDDFLDRAIYMTFAGIYGLRGRLIERSDPSMKVSAAMIVNMNIYAIRHSFWVPDIQGLEQRSFTELTLFREALIPHMILSPLASLTLKISIRSRRPVTLGPYLRPSRIKL